MSSDRALRTLWSDVSSLHLNAETSNTRYKLHLARLGDVYLGRHKGFVTEQRCGDRRFPGEANIPIAGRRWASPKKTKDPHPERREEGWDDRAVLYHSLHPHSDTHISPNTSSYSKKNRPSSSKSIHHSYKKSSPQLSTSPGPHGPARNEASRARCVDPTLTDQECVLNGLYRLNPDQRQHYESFVDTLSEYDPHDMVGERPLCMRYILSECRVLVGVQAY